MLVPLIVIQLSALVVANPFHKYPTVFLLDIGNEELQKTNSEQIRVSVPGGSVALRYPAIGDGNTIGHLRVSSIDFGTAFKANIVDGGPGYRYVVLVLMGNPGVPYDAVVTVQTVNDQDLGLPNIGYVPNSGSEAANADEAENNSAEDMSDDSLSPNSYQSENIAQSSNAELMQSSVNVYKYAETEDMEQSDIENHNFNDAESDEDDDEESNSDVSEADNESGERDIYKEYTDDIDQSDDLNVEVQAIDTEDTDNDDADNDEEVSPELAQSVPIDYEEDNEASSVIRSRINSNYDGFRPYLSGGKIYYEDADQKSPDYQKEQLDYDSPDEIQQIFNDGEVHNNADKYRDPNNNNYIDSDDNYAVAY